MTGWMHEWDPKPAPRPGEPRNPETLYQDEVDEERRAELADPTVEHYDWITDPVNANMRAEPPALCPAVCTTHQRGCALHLTPVDEHVTPKHRDPAWHLCNGGGMPHDFYETPA